MTSRQPIRRVTTLALVAVLIISLVPGNAAAVPDPDDLDYPEELVECDEWTDAVDPFSDSNVSEYTDCRQERLGQWSEQTVMQSIERSLRNFQTLENHYERLMTNLHSQVDRLRV